MQPIRYVCINAHENGTVNHAEIGWANDGEWTEVVLPLPLWTDVVMGELLDALAIQQGRYWLDSYVALLGLPPLASASFEDLWLLVMERNERHRYAEMSQPLPFDQERF